MDMPAAILAFLDRGPTSPLALWVGRRRNLGRVDALHINETGYLWCEVNEGPMEEVGRRFAWTPRIGWRCITSVPVGNGGRRYDKTIAMEPPKDLLDLLSL